MDQMLVFSLAYQEPLFILLFQTKFLISKNQIFPENTKETKKHMMEKWEE